MQSVVQSNLERLGYPPIVILRGVHPERSLNSVTARPRLTGFLPAQRDPQSFSKVRYPAIAALKIVRWFRPAGSDEIVFQYHEAISGGR